MTTTFTPEQLRRFAELGGWRRGAISGKWHRPGCEALCFDCACSPSSPDFTDLAACFEVLEHFRGERNLLWELGNRIDGKLYCMIEQREDNITEDEMPLKWVKTGDTKQAAIIAAVLAAGGKL